MRHASIQYATFLGPQHRGADRSGYCRDPGIRSPRRLVLTSEDVQNSSQVGKFSPVEALTRPSGATVSRHGRATAITTDVGAHVESFRCRDCPRRSADRLLRPAEHLDCARFDSDIDGAAVRLPVSCDHSRPEPCPKPVSVGRGQISTPARSTNRRMACGVDDADWKPLALRGRTAWLRHRDCGGSASSRTRTRTGRCGARRLVRYQARCESTVTISGDVGS